MCSAVKKNSTDHPDNGKSKKNRCTHKKDKKLPKAMQALPAVQLKDRRLFAIISNQTKRRAYYCPGQVLRTGDLEERRGEEPCQR